MDRLKYEIDEINLLIVKLENIFKSLSMKDEKIMELNAINLKTDTISKIISNNEISKEINMDNLLYTVPEVAKILKCDKNYVYNLINRGLLPCLMLKSKKILHSSLMDFINKYNGHDLSNLDDIKPVEVNKTTYFGD